MTKIIWTILLIATVSLGGSLRGQPSQPPTTISPAPPTTIGQYAPPHKLGVPDWVYNTRVPPALREQLEFDYERLNDLYARQNSPKATGQNLQELGKELADAAGSLAGPEVPKDIPEWVWSLDNQAQVKFFEGAIRRHVKEYHLEDIALSEDLVPSLRPARPTKIGSSPQGLLTSDDVKKILAADDDKWKRMHATLAALQKCGDAHLACDKACGTTAPMNVLIQCSTACAAADDSCSAKAMSVSAPKAGSVPSH